MLANNKRPSSIKVGDRAERRKRIPFKFLAGSTLERTGEKLYAQLPPPDTGLLPKEQIQFAPVQRKAPISAREDFFRVFREQPPLEAELTLDDVAPVMLPKCLHGVRLTRAEWIFESSYKRKFHSPQSPPISFECFRCNPCCIHGCPLDRHADAQAFAEGERVSAQCPECNPAITNPNLIRAHLHRRELGMEANKGLVEGRLVTSFGQVITKGGEWFVQGGGSKAIEELDLASTNREDLFPVSSPEGCGSDTDIDDDVDGWAVDDLGDPIWTGQTELTKSAEKIRRGETSETLRTRDLYEVKQSGQHKKWFVVKDGDPVVLGQQIRYWRSKRAAEQYVNAQLMKEVGGEEIDHWIQDVTPKP